MTRTLSSLFPSYPPAVNIRYEGRNLLIEHELDHPVKVRSQIGFSAFSAPKGMGSDPGLPKPCNSSNPIGSFDCSSCFRGVGYYPSALLDTDINNTPGSQAFHDHDLSKIVLNQFGFR